MKLPVFHNKGEEDAEQQWFLYDIIWNPQITLDAIRLVEFQSTIWERVLKQYMKYKQSAHILHGVDLVQLWDDFVKEFQNPNLKKQSVIELKHIKNKVRETIWEYDKWIWNLVNLFPYMIQEVQHKEWFISGLLPCLHIPPLQQYMLTQMDVLQFTMWLESNKKLVEASVPRIGMAQFQYQLMTLFEHI